MEGIPKVVRQFVAKHIHSMDVLEILLLLRQEDRKEWEALEIIKALQLQRASVEARLDQLLSVGLLAFREIGTERFYKYQPQTAELVKAVNELAKWYASHRVALVSLIFSHHTDEIRTYPDMDRGTEEEK